MGCDDYQVAIERELHGALPEPERASLQDHLRTCPACRAYQATARATEGAMAMNASEALRDVDWSKVERGIREGVLSTVRGVVAAVLGGGFMAALVWLTATPETRVERMLRVGGALGTTVVLVALIMGFAAWRLARLERGAEMLDAWRQGVRARVRISRVMPWVAGLLALIFAWRAATGPSQRVNDPVFYGVLAAGMAALALYDRLVKLPRARRELEELERDEKA